MTFARWCASTLATQDPEQCKNTDAALRADIKGYANYVANLPYPMPDEHRANRCRIEAPRAKTFNFTPVEQSPGPLGIHWPWSLSDFRNVLAKNGYRPSMNSGWVEDAYLLYLGMFADEAAVNGFALARDWWARGDRRELEGLPRHDLLTVKIKSGMRRLVLYIVSLEDQSTQLAAQGCLSPVLLMLNRCMEEHRELTAEQWEYVHGAHNHAERVAAVVAARLQERGIDRRLETPMEEIRAENLPRQ